MEQNQTKDKTAFELVPEGDRCNKAEVVGVLRRAARTKDLERGLMATFSLEVPRTYPAGGGKGKDRSFVPVVAFDAIARQIEAAPEGSVVRVSGPLKTFAGQNGSGWQVRAQVLNVARRPAAEAASA